MIDIYGKEMYNLLHEGTHQAKAGFPLHESDKTSKGSRTALHRNVKDRSGTTQAYGVSRYSDCQGPALSGRQAVGRGRRRLTYPFTFLGVNTDYTLTYPTRHNIPYSTQSRATPGNHPDNTSCNFCVFSCLKKGGINNCLATALIPHIAIPKRYRT